MLLWGRKQVILLLIKGELFNSIKWRLFKTKCRKISTDTWLVSMRSSKIEIWLLKILRSSATSNSIRKEGVLRPLMCLNPQIYSILMTMIAKMKFCRNLKSQIVDYHQRNFPQRLKSIDKLATAEVAKRTQILLYLLDEIMVFNQPHHLKLTIMRMPTKLMEWETLLLIIANIKRLQGEFSRKENCKATKIMAKVLWETIEVVHRAKLTMNNQWIQLKLGKILNIFNKKEPHQKESPFLN